MSGVADNMPLPRRKKIDVPKKTLKPGDKYPGWKGSLDYSDIKNPEKAGPNKPFTKKQKDQIYTKIGMPTTDILLAIWMEQYWKLLKKVQKV